jgi:hypothetical protein
MRYAGLNNLETNEMFQNFSREMRVQFPEFDGYRPMTAEQIVSREGSVSVIVGSLLKRDEEASAGYGR